jgi:hypothetical protein
MAPLSAKFAWDTQLELVVHFAPATGQNQKPVQQ